MLRRKVLVHKITSAFYDAAQTRMYGAQRSRPAFWSLLYCPAAMLPIEYLLEKGKNTTVINLNTT